MTDHHLIIEDLHFSRGDRVIFSGLNMVISPGKITAVMGPSGTGKTTLLNLISAQIKPDRGHIWFEGKDIHTLSRKDLYSLRKKMGMLFQNGGLFTHMNVFENIAFPLREHTDLPEAVLHDHVLFKLEAVGLRGTYHMMPHELSGGMARRIALARAIVMDPHLVMYDEPFTGQDPISMGILLQLIQRLNQVLGFTSVIVSHDVQETTCIADYIYIIAGGKVIGEGTTNEIKTSTIPSVNQFIKGLPDGVIPFHYPAVPIEEAII